LSLPVDGDISTNLYAGIITNTANFQGVNVKASAFEAAGWCLKNGARKNQLGMAASGLTGQPLTAPPTTSLNLPGLKTSKPAGFDSAFLTRPVTSAKPAAIAKPAMPIAKKPVSVKPFTKQTTVNSQLNQQSVSQSHVQPTTVEPVVDQPPVNQPPVDQSQVNQSQTDQSPADQLSTASLTESGAKMVPPPFENSSPQSQGPALTQQSTPPENKEAKMPPDWFKPKIFKARK
jgi:hypothetical protein